MTSGTATYSSDELDVAFSATGIVTDYGVPHSPTWTDWEDIKIEELTILGHKVDPKILSAELVEAIRELADDLEFEAEEPDCPDDMDDGPYKYGDD
jgi:hypothetical protein